jgi:hypothetical protein
MNFQNFWPGFETSTVVQSIFTEVMGQGTLTQVGCMDPPPVLRRIPGYTFSGEPNHNCVGDVNFVPGGDVPIHLFSLYAYEQDAWPKMMSRTNLSTPDRFCAFCVSNGNRGYARIRNTFFQLLSQYKKVDSCGSFMNNIGYRAPMDNSEYWKFLSHYKFNICFENTDTKDYVTEKLVNAYLGGSIPIYWGTPQVLEWFNPKAFLYLEDVNDMQSLVNKVIELDTNDELYQQMRSEPLLTEIPHDMKIETWKQKFQDLMIKRSLDCRV